jgi:class 3 adenylate cyclase
MCSRQDGAAGLASDRVERRLTAILAADVAGYSRLMGADEEETLARLKAHRHEVVDPRIGEHRGRIVKTTGDGLLAEFASVVDGVRCAVEIQRGMAKRNADVPPDRRIEFRVGIFRRKARSPPVYFEFIQLIMILGVSFSRMSVYDRSRRRVTS